MAPNPAGKTGMGGVASSEQENRDRKERLRQLAMETIDLAKDPYFMRNHLGTYECKLCLTLHTTEANYLVHTQGRKHQTNLAKRAAREEALKEAQPAVTKRTNQPKKRSIKIGRPGYKVTKQRDPDTGQLSLLFEVDYPEIEEGLQPRHRVMSSFEQKIETPDKEYQYLLFAADPYETIAFKIPNRDIDKDKDKFFTNWDRDNLKFTLLLHFAAKKTESKIVPLAKAAAGKEDEDEEMATGVPLAGQDSMAKRQNASSYNPMMPKERVKG